MTDDNLYERFECIDLPRHRKFYKLEVKLTLFYPKILIRRWGRIGTRRARELRCVYPAPEALGEAIEHIRARRFRHGYQRVCPRTPEEERDRAAQIGREHPVPLAIPSIIPALEKETTNGLRD